jgi:hypothetical protein
MDLKPLTSTLSLLSLVIMASINLPAVAMTLNELEQADKVRIRTWVEPVGKLISRQQVNLQIEVATDKWFSGGTKIGSFELNDAIVLQREKFAVNSSRNVGGKSWTVQEWTLAIYPQRTGLFEIPEIPVQISIAGENLESIVGTLAAPALEFIAEVPEPTLDGMTSKTDWVATTRFEVKENYDKTFEDLKPGNAIVRSINMSADNLPAMMLPGIDSTVIDGIAVYPKPPQLLDKVNRGTYLAEKSQTITYVFEKAGEYELPRKVFFWWNLNSQSFESIELDAQVFEVIDLEVAAGEDPVDQATSGIFDSAASRLLLMKTGILFLIVILVGILIRGLSRITTTKIQDRPEKPAEATLLKEFATACRNNDLEQAMGLFYQWLDHYGGDSFKGSVRTQLVEMNQTQLTEKFSDIMQAIYTPLQDKSVDLKMFARQFTEELKKSNNPAAFNGLRVELKLN